MSLWRRGFKNDNMIIIPGRIDASGNPIASILIVINLLSLIAIVVGYFCNIEIVILIGIYFAALIDIAAFITWLIYLVNKHIFGGE